MSTTISTTPRHESGSVLAGMLISIIIIGGLAGIMIMRGASGQQATRSTMERSRLLFVSEAGLNYNFLQLEADPVYAVKDITGFTWDPGAKTFRSKLLKLDASGGVVSQSFSLEIQYLQSSSPVTFADRANPTESFDQVKVISAAASAQDRRVVAAWYSYHVDPAFNGAIVSDMVATPGMGDSKQKAQLGNVVLDGKGRSDQQAVFGDLKANGEIWYYKNKAAATASQMTTANASSNLAGWNGEIQQNLVSTPQEIPDFTNLGGPNQLFDFDRFQAAAAAGAGQVYNRISDFVAAMSTANGMGESLEGITVLVIDPAVEGSNPKIKMSGAKKSTEYNLPGGMNIHGTLVFRFVNGTSPTYKVVIETALNVNPADLSSLNPAVESTYTTGYPPSYKNPTKRPSAVDISPAYENFGINDDLPAVMFNNAVVDIHGPANVSGVVYGPSFVEIENKNNSTQYFNGAIYGGAGVLLEGSGQSGGIQAIRFDPNTIDSLETMKGKGQELKRTQFAIVR